MPKLYETFKVLKVQKRIVFAETISGNTVVYGLFGQSNMHRTLDFCPDQIKLKSS